MLEHVELLLLLHVCLPGLVRPEELRPAAASTHTKAAAVSAGAADTTRSAFPAAAAAVLRRRHD